jgi:topoisomerase IV subunit B
VSEPGIPTKSTTHDWMVLVDREHLAHIRQQPAAFAPGGILHLVLEVIAYAADEAERAGAGRCWVTLFPDGSIAVSDAGRGTDTRLDNPAAPIRKPVMASKDLRFFDAPDTPSLPDGQPRRGMSVVAALSDWLVHTNRRADGAWTQRYEHGLPVTDLCSIEPDGTTGTNVWFHPAEAVDCTLPSATELTRLVAEWPHLPVEISDCRLR